MTHRNTNTTTPWGRIALTFGMAALLASPLALTGCKKKKKTRAPKPVVVDDGPQTPEWETLSSTMELSPKLMLDGVYEDCDSEQMRAVFNFMDSFATGNDGKARAMMNSEGNRIMDELVDNDGWEDTTGDVHEVLLLTCVGDSNDKVKVEFTLFYEDRDALNMYWTGRTRGDSVVFAADYKLDPTYLEERINELSEEIADDLANEGGNAKDRQRPVTDPRKLVPTKGPTGN